MTDQAAHALPRPAAEVIGCAVTELAPPVEHGAQGVASDRTASDATARRRTARRRTARRRTEDALRASEERFRAMFEAAPLGVALVDSLTGRFLETNPQFAAIAGRTREEMRALDWMSITHPDDMQLDLDNTVRFNAGEISGYGSEKRYLRPDGSAVWVRLTVAPAPTGDPDHPQHLSMVEDITDRRRTQDELRRRNAFVETILENAPIGFAVNEIDTGLPVFVSRRFAQIYGVTPEQITSVPDFFAVVYRDPVFREEIRARILGDLASGDPARLRWEDIPILIGAGERRYVTAGNIPLPDQNLMISTVQDVTARKRAELERASLEAQLNQAQKMESVGRLAGGVAHDFNNLLTAINGFGGLLATTLPPESSAASDLSEMLRAAERATELTRQLLAFSRQTILQPRVVDLSTVLMGVVPMLRRVLGEDVELVISTAGGSGRALADPGQLEQVIVNLALNARDAMPDGGRLTIETGIAEIGEAESAAHPDLVPGRHVRLAVSDTGHGMAPEVLEHIFEPFFTTKGSGRGTGLGLSTAFGIIRQSNGSIVADSEPGRGSTLTVYLPRVDSPASPLAAPSASPPTAPGPAGPRAYPGGAGTILLVEDEDSVRLFAQRVLEGAGYRVLPAADGTEALRFVGDDTRIDLLFTDIVMPGLSGPQVAREVLAARPEVAVLYTSGYTPDATLRLSVIDSRVPFLAKPYDAVALVARVREALPGKPPGISTGP